MRKIALGLGAMVLSALVSVSAAHAAPIPAAPLGDQAIAGSANDGIVWNAHITDSPRHNCRRHGVCGGGFHFGGGGIYIGPGYYNYHGTYSRSCRRVRRWCRREWGGGRRYRRCVRRQDCRP